MNKIAAYEVALSQLGEEFDYLYEPSEATYLGREERLAALEKAANFKAIGQVATGGLYRLGKALGGTGASGSRTGIGGKLMDFASGLGGNVKSKAAKSRIMGMQTAAREAGNPMKLSQLKAAREAQQANLGKAVVGGGLATAGLGGAALGRMTS